MTYRKIAQLAGVSLSTVSKALSGSSEISLETAERIRRIAEENNVQRPKYHRNRSNPRVAILIPEIVSMYYSQLGTEIINELRRYNIEPFIYICGFNGERFCNIIDTICEEQSADGIISLSENDYFHSTSVPIVGFIISSLYPHFNSVGLDIQTGIFNALEYLCSLGHRKIGFISEKNTDAKLNVFKNASSQLGIKISDDFIYISRKRFAEIGCEAAEYYMKLPELPTALIAAYDEIALGAIRTFTNNGFNIPSDISVIGINDNSDSLLSNIKLTTIRTHGEEIITRGTKLLLEQIKNPDRRIIQHISIKCELIIRDTAAKAKES